MIMRLMPSMISAAAIAAAVAFAPALPASPHARASAAAADVRSPHAVPGADWVAYLDISGFTKSVLGSHIIRNSDGLHLDLEGVEQCKQQFGIDPLTDVRDITISGGGDPDSGQFALIANTTAAIDNLVAQLTGKPANGGRPSANEDEDNDDDVALHMPPVEMVEIDGQQVYAARDGDRQAFFHVRSGPTSNDRVVVVSMNKDWMARGMKAAGDLAGRDTSPAKPAAGAFVFLRVNDLGWLDLDAHEQPASAIARNAKGLTFNLGETGDDTFLNLRVITATDDDAQNLSDIAQGLLAMGRLAARNEPDLQQMLAPLRSLALKADGPAVTLTFTHNSKELIELLDDVAGGAALGAEIGADPDDGTVSVGVRVGSTNETDEDSED